MEKELIEKLNRFYLDFNVGVYVDERLIYPKYSILYSNNINSIDCNFALDLKANSKEEFEEIYSAIKENMNKISKKPTFAILPIQEYLYNNRNELFKDFEVVSQEVWQVLDNFENIDNIETNCDLNISLELVSDYKKFAEELAKSFKGDENDPYGELETGYTEILKNYKNNENRFIKEFYFIKNQDSIVGVTAAVYDDKFYGIHSLAIKRDYRAKGIGKEVLKQQLKMCRDKKLTAFLQTEEGFYPAKLYRKIGFRDVAIEYYYQEK